MHLSAWGKCKPNGKRHPLNDHCLDVAVVFHSLLSIRSIARTMPIDAQQAERLAVLAFLHDFGKCNWGFQAKANPRARQTAGHVMEGVALLSELHDYCPQEWRALIAEICSWFQGGEEQGLQMLLASISHHGRPVSLNDYAASGVERLAKKWWSATGDYDPMAALASLAHAARRAFPRAFGHGIPLINATPALQQRFAGLVMLADWIASDEQFFPYRQCDSEDRLALARQAACHALRQIGLIVPVKRSPKPFASTFGFAPTPLQAALAREITPGEDTRLLLAESDTGSGKTEAALAWFMRLYAEGLVDGLYFALPTRVAARELYERVRQAIHAAFAEEPPGPVLLAAPGYVKVDGRAVHDILPDPVGVQWSDDLQDTFRVREDAWRERMWSAERPKRFLAAPVAVGTIDQALLSVLKVKHSLLRSVCLDRHLLVVDEVHASDPYMREVLSRLLMAHTSRGGFALLLSATLGEAAAACYFSRQAAPLDRAIARPYPLLSAHNHMWPMPPARTREIDIELSNTLVDDAALLPRLIDALECGARVLVVCNTVSRANTLFRRVEDRLKDTHPHLLAALFHLNGQHCPHHGRFAREDRERLDAAVTQQLGKASAAGARLLIGTQTLEQSLDIDADWLVTDLAPMDVLIQRLGRLHRHTRERPPGFTTPKALVRTPPKALIEYLKDGELRAPAGLGSVYADGQVLALTWDSLQHKPHLELPSQARERIERTTHPQALDALADAWREHGARLQGKVQADVLQALHSVINEAPFGELHYNDKGEQVLTRLGLPTYDIPLEQPMPSPFGVDIRRVAIPAHWLDVSVGALPETVRAEPTADGFCFKLGTKSFRYTRFGLEKDDA
ncbi:MAG: CRISPR-associated helicase Cas3' [Tepidimonas sp.]|uniref:CRISPR-associated helicase Cas3' n=1 Tax=Tepidimonas sp. TaxID=2002775 RepID=UPI0040552E41